MRPSLLALGLLVATSAHAQTTLPFPAHMMPTQPGGEVLEFTQDAGILAELAELQTVTLVGLPLPVGSTVTLKLARLQFDPRQVGVHVDGARASYDPGDLSLWEGEVLDAKGSRVYLAFSSYGSYGWIHDGVDYTHVSSFAAPDNDWSQARMRMYSSRALAAAPGTGGPECQLDSLRGGPLGSGIVNPTTIDPPTYGAATMLECKMAVETDYQLFKLWNDLAAEQTYVMALIGSVSNRFEQQVDVRITYPYVQFYTNIHDPWTSQDTGGGSGDLLSEFQAAWGPAPLPWGERNDARLGRVGEPRFGALPEVGLHPPCSAGLFDLGAWLWHWTEEGMIAGGAPSFDGRIAIPAEPGLSPVGIRLVQDP